MASRPDSRPDSRNSVVEEEVLERIQQIPTIRIPTMTNEQRIAALTLDVAHVWNAQQHAGVAYAEQETRLSQALRTSHEATLNAVEQRLDEYRQENARWRSAMLVHNDKQLNSVKDFAVCVDHKATRARRDGETNRKKLDALEARIDALVETIDRRYEVIDQQIRDNINKTDIFISRLTDQIMAAHPMWAPQA